MQLHVPALLADALQQGLPWPGTQIRQGLAHEIQAHAPDPKAGHFFQGFALDVLLQHHHPAQLPRHGLQGAEQVTVVGAQETGLHQHAMAEAMALQLAQVIAQRRVVTRRVAALAGQVQATAEHVGMAVDGGNQ